MSIRPDRYTIEIRLQKVRKPRAGRRWRWDTTVYRLTDGLYPGVLDTRQHMTGDCGYTRTKIGAAWEIYKSNKKYGEHFEFA